MTRRRPILVLAMLLLTAAAYRGSLLSRCAHAQDAPSQPVRSPAPADPATDADASEWTYVRVLLTTPDAHAGLQQLRYTHGLSARWVSGVGPVLRAKIDEAVAVHAFASALPLVRAIERLSPEETAKITPSLRFEPQQGRFRRVVKELPQVASSGGSDGPIEYRVPPRRRSGASVTDLPGEVVGSPSLGQYPSLPSAGEVLDDLCAAIEAKLGVKKGAALPRTDGWTLATASSVPSVARGSRVITVRGLRGRINSSRNLWEIVRCEITVSVLSTREVFVLLRCRGWFTTVTHWDRPWDRYEDIESTTPSEKGWVERLTALVLELTTAVDERLSAKISSGTDR